MKRSFTIATVAALAFSMSALIGCEETISKKETVKTRSDGTQIKTTDTVKRQPDGTVVHEYDKETNR
jgi:hypothetical protein